jgi:hypothetical protein
VGLVVGVPEGGSVNDHGGIKYEAGGERPEGDPDLSSGHKLEATNTSLKSGAPQVCTALHSLHWVCTWWIVTF